MEDFTTSIQTSYLHSCDNLDPLGSNEGLGTYENQSEKKVQIV